MRKNHDSVSLKLFARFYVADCGLWLGIDKTEKGICYSGGTEKGQDIPVGRLIDSFIKDALNYDVALPGCLLNFVIDHIKFSYSSDDTESSFSFDCSASFGGGHDILSKLFRGGASVCVGAKKTKGAWAYSFHISCEIVINDTQTIEGLYDYDKLCSEKANSISLKYQAKNPGDEITFGQILELIGFAGISESWRFLMATGITCAEMSYDFIKNKLTAKLVVNSGGELGVKIAFGDETGYDISLSTTASFSVADIPIAGGIAEKIYPPVRDYSVSDISLHILSPQYATAEIPAGVGLAFKVFGFGKYCLLYKADKKRYSIESVAADTGSSSKTVWLNVEKRAAIFTLHKLGLALDGGNLGILIDASLSVPPLTFDLLGLGVSFGLSKAVNLKFMLTGLGISFKNDSLSISGSFMRSKAETGADIYTGSLSITAGQISAFAVGQYSDGSLMAYACVNIPLGGPPAFFIKGLAAGFGYNQGLKMPEIIDVPSYPLIAGSKGEISRENLPEKLKQYVTPLSGQNFLAAGVHFTTFEIADSFIMAVVSFGKRFEINILGLSDITMPPKCKKNPIAHAQLALKAVFAPDDGIFSVEARLTGESYILSKNCKLTGGFAFYLWFSGDHDGDFVITLGGYHPAYKKPAHYPDVPRLGFRWDLLPETPNRLVLSGELYFALTPSAIMAGGRLSAVYAVGNLRAWFIARADFLILWKPFHYDIEIGISLGASYKLDLYLVSCTFKLELNCDLHLWGPDFSGKARISWFIISFTIRFGSASQTVPAIDWDEFSQSFLPKEKPAKKSLMQNDTEIVNPLSINISRGITGRADMGGSEIEVVRAEDFELSCTTAFPCLETGKDIYVKPMGKKVKNSKIDIKLLYTGISAIADQEVALITQPVAKNVPAALWGVPGATSEMVPAVLCGLTCTVTDKASAFFPRNCYISAEMLSDINKLERRDAFLFGYGRKLPKYEDKGTVRVVTETASALKTEGKAFLERMGYSGGCDIALFAADADSLLDEDIFVGDII